MEVLKVAHDAVTSKGTRRAIVKLALLTGSSLALLFLSIIATAVFFASYIPDKARTWPVYLQYGVGDNPFGVTPVTAPLPKTEQYYDISVTVTLPESPRNMDRGNFMIALHLLDTDLTTTLDVVHTPESGKSLIDPQSVMFTTRRPALMPYVDPAVSLARRLVFLPLHLLFPKNELHTMTVPLAEGVVFARSSRVPKSIYVELQAGQNFQTSEVSVTMTANLRGLRYILHNYRIISFVALTLGFWSMEMLFAGMALFILGIFVGNQEHPEVELKPKPKPKPEPDTNEAPGVDREEEKMAKVELEEPAGRVPVIKREHEHEHEPEQEQEREVGRKSSEDHPGLRRRRTSFKHEEGEASGSGTRDEMGIKREPESD